MSRKVLKKLKWMKQLLKTRMLAKEKRRKRRKVKTNNSKEEEEGEVPYLCKVWLLFTTNLTVLIKRIPKTPSKTTRKVVMRRKPFLWIDSKLTVSTRGSSKKRNSEKWKKRKRNSQIPNKISFVLYLSKRFRFIQNF